MRKILFFIILLLAVSIVGGHYPAINLSHSLIGETVVNYEKTDSFYRLYGTYRKIYKKYNYHYYDSVYLGGKRIDDMHGWDYYKNEYGDTVCIVYTDYTNYPRREE